jgi:hypothetical protein
MITIDRLIPALLRSCLERGKSLHMSCSRGRCHGGDAFGEQGGASDTVCHSTVCDRMCGYQRLLDRIDLDNCIVTRAQLRFGCSQRPIYVLVGVLRDLSG